MPEQQRVLIVGFKQDIKKILKSQSGVAIMMIMTSILILMAIYGEFTFESKISRIKATNLLDRSQAKLLAESGLQLAVTRLRLYKEAYNYVQNNANAAAVPVQLINQLWEVPFMFPIPVGKGANRAFIDTVDKFTKETFLDGQMSVNIQNISNRMNLNLLRNDMTKMGSTTGSAGGGSNGMPDNSILDMSDQAIMNDVSIDQTLYFILKRLVDEKKEKDETFADRYGSINYQEMMSNLKYYMSDFGSMMQDPMVGEAETNFQQAKITPKFGPFSSASELYSVPGWNDELIELIKNEFSVYPNTQIDFNKLTANMFKILIPNVNDNDIKEFFLWRDDPEQPKQVNSLDDFKKYVVMQERLISEDQFNDRMNKFQQKGITFGANPNLFKVVSEGTYNRSVYTLVAYVVLPKAEPQVAVNPNANNPNNNPKVDAFGNPIPNGPNNNTNTGTTTTGTGSGAAQKAQLLEPRVIEIQVN